jgi:hypothetical protein
MAELELPEGNTRAARDAITLPDTYADLDLFAASADFDSFAECEPFLCRVRAGSTLNPGFIF